jgi:cytochrome c oxidase cbb3-type subunit 2
VAGRIHSSHQLILILATGIYLILVLLCAILPALTLAQAYPPPKVPLEAHAAHGRELYVAYGCIACHTQQIRGDERQARYERDPSKGQDAPPERIVPVLPVDLRFGRDRASRPEDYAGDNPILLGTERTGPDLTNVGTRLPKAEWHYWHLYNPSAVSPDSRMPAMPWLFKTKESDAKQDVDLEVPYIEALHIPSRKLYATPDAQDLVEYILSLDQGQQR